MLSLDYFAQSKTANLLGISEKTIPFLVKSLNSQIDYILTRKKMAQEFIEMNYGENFLLNVFGKTLSARQFRVLKGYIMDYHYLSQMDFNRKIGEGRNYASQTEATIIKKLDNYYEKFDEETFS